MKWRVVEIKEDTAAMNMALDEAIAEGVRNKESPPTIRFYTWKPSAVSIGYFQGLADEVDTEKCEELGVDVVRRRTGGGAVYHDAEITYSVIAPESFFPKDIIASYKEICGWISDALAQIGIPSEFIPINDILASGKKISGNAQTRRKGVLLQHGTILYNVDVAKMFSLLKVPDEKIRDKLIKTVQERVTSISHLKDVSREEAYQALLKAFTKNKEFEMGIVSPEEQERAQELVETRYATSSWNAMR